MDVSVEERGLVSVEEFGPTSADEDVAQEAEELKHVPAPVMLSKAEAHLPCRSWCSACVRGRGFSFGHRKVDVKTKGAEQTPTVCGLRVLLATGKTEHMPHFQCSSCEIARVKVSGVTRCRQRV